MYQVPDQNRERGIRFGKKEGGRKRKGGAAVLEPESWNRILPAHQVFLRLWHLFAHYPVGEPPLTKNRFTEFVKNMEDGFVILSRDLCEAFWDSVLIGKRTKDEYKLKARIEEAAERKCPVKEKEPPSCHVRAPTDDPKTKIVFQRWGEFLTTKDRLVPYTKVKSFHSKCGRSIANDSDNKDWSPREFVEKVADSRVTPSLSRIQGNLCYLYIRQEGKSGNTAAFDFLWEHFMDYLTRSQRRSHQRHVQELYQQPRAT